MLSRRALAACHFELNDCKGIPVTQHWLTGCSRGWNQFERWISQTDPNPNIREQSGLQTPTAMERVSLCAQN
jgi:hypothetical protein